MQLGSETVGLGADPGYVDSYSEGHGEGVTDKSLGHAYDDGFGPPHRLIVCVPRLDMSQRAGYRNGWLEPTKIVCTYCVWRWIVVVQWA